MYILVHMHFLFGHTFFMYALYILGVHFSSGYIYISYLDMDFLFEYALFVGVYSGTSEERTLWERHFCPFFGGCPYLGGS